MMRLIGALLAGLIIGALAGGAMYGLERIGFYLIVLFPILAGALVGGAVGLFDRDARIRGLPIIALIGGLVALGVYWGASYYFYIEDAVTQVQADSPKTTREDVLALIDQYHMEEFGVTGVQGFFADIALSGMTITRGLAETGITLEGNIAYAFWIFEAVLLLGAAVLGCVRRGATKFARPAPAPISTGTGGSLADLQKDVNAQEKRS